VRAACSSGGIPTIGQASAAVTRRGLKRDRWRIAVFRPALRAGDFLAGCGAEVDARSSNEGAGRVEAVLGEER
jgi:hypothetical protein